MSAELANKVNILCQKVKRLSKRERTLERTVERTVETVETVADKEYLYATLSNENNVTLNTGEPVPYNSLNISDNITMDTTSGTITVSSDGIYRITFAVYFSSGTSVAGLVIAVNGTSYPKAQHLVQYRIAVTP